jgi:hypothetical protein
LLIGDWCPEQQQQDRWRRTISTECSARNELHHDKVADERGKSEEETRKKSRVLRAKVMRVDEYLETAEGETRNSVTTAVVAVVAEQVSTTDPR